MMAMRTMAFILALLSGALAGFLLSRAFAQRRLHAKSREEAMRRSGAAANGYRDAFSCSGVAARTLGYSIGLQRRLRHGAAKPLAGWMPQPSDEARRRFEDTCLKAGLRGELAFETVREARVRLSALIALVGLILGACISNELMVLFLVAGLCAGAFLPGWAVKQELVARNAQLKHELPEMLEVVSLGITSGLTFDRSFGLYPSYFDTSFARDCKEAHRKWTLGLVSREEALQDLARAYDSALLDRVVQNVIRSMRFGTRMSDDLARAAAESRAEQKSSRQEQVAKVPVRMMIPTACLILPAMLLLVLGPVLLELIKGF